MRSQKKIWRNVSLLILFKNSLQNIFESLEFIFLNVFFSEFLSISYLLFKFSIPKIKNLSDWKILVTAHRDFFKLMFFYILKVMTHTN